MKVDNNGIWVEDKVETDRYPENSHNESFEIEESSFWFTHRNNIILSVFKKIGVKKNIVDIGGGNGLQAKFLENNLLEQEIFMAEPGYSGCLNAKKRGLKNVFNVLFQNFNFAENRIEAACLFDVLEHIVDDKIFLQELTNSVPAGGYIFITVPAYQWLWNDVDEFGKHARRYTLAQLRELGKSCGLQTVYANYFFQYLVLPTLLLRRIPYLFGQRRTAAEINKTEVAQHETKGITNNMFAFFNKRELEKIATNKKMNYGASCIIVFKK